MKDVAHAGCVVGKSGVKLDCWDHECSDLPKVGSGCLPVEDNKRLERVDDLCVDVEEVDGEVGEEGKQAVGLDDSFGGFSNLGQPAIFPQAVEVTRDGGKICGQLVPVGSD